MTMEIETTFIEGFKILHLSKFNDTRGSFQKTYNKDFYEQNSLRTDFKESYFSVSNKDVIRGMHFQNPPFEHVKLVYLNQGRMVDCVLDLRKSSTTYGRFYSIELLEDAPKLLYIPIGCAHGFRAIEDNTIVTYLQTSVYNAKADSGIRYDSFEMEWKCLFPVISSRDLSFPSFTNFKSCF